MLIEQLVTIATSLIVTITTTVVGLIVSNYVKQKQKEDKQKDAEFELAKIQVESLIETMIYLNKDTVFEETYDKLYRDKLAKRKDLYDLTKEKLNQ